MSFLRKIQANIYQYYKELEISEHRLQYLFLELTQRCNLNCLHCGSDCKSTVNKAELTTESWFRIIDYMHQNYGTSLSFVITGGEPLLHKDLDKIGAYIKQKNMRWGTVTNGMLLDITRMKALEDAGIYSLTLSVDGLEHAHNFLRNSSSAFRKVLIALDALGKSQIKFKDAVTCVYPKNLNELSQIANLLLSKGINSWRLFRIFPSGRAQNNAEIQLSFSQTQELLTWIAQNKKTFKTKGLDLNLSCEGYLPFEEDMKLRNQPFFCRAGISIASILSDGTITGCTNNHNSFYEGNILNDNFGQLWDKGFHKFRQREWIKKTICANCEYSKYCQGGSIHLWELPSEKPKFCYVNDLSQISDKE